MQAWAVRIRLDRKTGKPMGLVVTDAFEISEEECGEMEVRAMTGKTPEEVAAEVVKEFCA